MFRLRYTIGLSERTLAALIVASFGAMILALPIIRWLHLQDFVACPFHALTGIACPTCGFTRVYSLIQAGQLAAAVQFQPFVLLIAGLSGAAALQAVSCLWRKHALTLPRSLAGGIWVALAASWVWNLYYGI